MPTPLTPQPSPNRHRRRAEKDLSRNFSPGSSAVADMMQGLITSGMRDLISPKTRTEFREYFVSTTLAVIDDAFRSEGFTADLDFEPPVRGQRRTLVEQYYKNINLEAPGGRFTRPAHLRRRTS